MDADIIYLGSLIDNGDDNHDIEDLLRPYLSTLLSLPSPIQASSPKVLFELFYGEKIATSSSSTKDTPNSPRGIYAINDVSPAIATLSEVGDASAVEAQRIFWEVTKFLSSLYKGEQQDASPSSFWPPLEPEELDREPGEDW